ncbi:MAG TPA: hypothetical protein VKZ77_13515 [Bacillaceae bacterium]|nr:hypothetical protein [Paenibacillus bovis]HLU23477.1 hypothetical protein [Bacillaceae bacterium]
MRKYLFYILLGLMILSWGLGIYYVTAYDIPISVVPLLDNKFYWASSFKAMLGLTIIITIISLVAFMFRKYYNRFSKWYIIHGVGIFLWGFTLFSQARIAAFNLGICH